MRHHVIDEAAGLARVEERQDVRVLQVCGDADFAQEPLDAEQRRELGFQHLERDVAVVLQIARDVHGGHAAHAGLTLDGVVLGEGR